MTRVLLPDSSTDLGTITAYFLSTAIITSPIYFRSFYQIGIHQLSSLTGRSVVIVTVREDVHELSIRNEVLYNLVSCSNLSGIKC